MKPDYIVVVLLLACVFQLAIIVKWLFWFAPPLGKSLEDLGEKLESLQELLEEIRDRDRA